mmetsp:Transcript_14724/g.35930  ORF Transcript_14724/g.35930 Transcript_14724/m.35930 type:complete len:140 (+) Transcript_14724:2186-2605(+)
MATALIDLDVGTANVSQSGVEILAFDNQRDHRWKGKGSTDFRNPVTVTILVSTTAPLRAKGQSLGEFRDNTEGQAVSLRPWFLPAEISVLVVAEASGEGNRVDAVPPLRSSTTEMTEASTKGRYVINDCRETPGAQEFR